MEELRPVVVGQFEWLCRDPWSPFAQPRSEGGPSGFPWWNGNAVYEWLAQHYGHPYLKTPPWQWHPRRLLPAYLPSAPEH